MLISEVREDGFVSVGGFSSTACLGAYPRASNPLRLVSGRCVWSSWYQPFFMQVCVLQDSRFEVSKNGTLRINSVEVYDGTLYRCVSSTPAGSIEAQARVQVLGELAYTMCWEGTWPVWAEEQWEGAAGMALPSLPVSIPPSSLTQRNSSSRPRRSHSSAWSLIRRPRCPAQPLAERSPQLSGYGQVGTM